MTRLPLSRYCLLGMLGVVYLATALLLRLVLWWQFGSNEGVTALALPGILLIGVLNDSVELLYLLLPVSLYLWLMPRRWFSTRVNALVLALGLLATLVGLFFNASAEFFFFEEFDSRFNLVAVDYLIYPHEVFINLWESYPVAAVLGVVVLLSAALLHWFWPKLSPSGTEPLPLRARSAVFAGHLLAVFLSAASFSTDTLAVFDNRVSNEIAANGISSFFHALRTNELAYDLHYRTGDKDRMLARVASELASDEGQFTRLAAGRLDRIHPARPNGLGQRNVVVIVEESFGAEFVGKYGDTRNLTPRFDALADEGLLFTNTYSTGTRTVRGLEANTLSFPPIPSESVVKRPGSENMANWGQVMRSLGYHSSFLYGGYGYFDNMNHFYETNGFTISDRSAISDVSFANIWGVCDEDLFRHAVRYFGERHEAQQPFFSIIMTTSNHKPFSFPAGIPGVPEEGGGRLAGIRYADYALGRFFDMAREQPWYHDTVFVVVADHGARVYGQAQIPLKKYEIPLLVMGEGIAPQKVDTLTSQVDVAPTVLGLLGLPYEAPFFGQDVLANNGRSHPLLFNHNHNVALYKDGEIAILGLQKEADTFSYDADRDSYSQGEQPNQSLIELAVAYYQVAFEQFRNHTYQ